jgi:predicted MPP superfamily phosphohydrolase
MKLVAIGDIHGRGIWKQIVAKEHDTTDEFVFVGDYFDSFTVKGPDQINNFLDIIEFKKQSKAPVTLLIGNHDYHYYPGIEDSGTSGYQALMAPSIKHVVGDNKQHLQVAYQVDEFIFSHAGLSSEWLDDMMLGWDASNMVNRVNELFQYQPDKIAYRSFKYYDYSHDRAELASGYGNETFQGPLWIRPAALMAANKDTKRKNITNKETLKKQIIQVVGHTPQDTIDIEGKSTGGRYYFIDTLEYGQNQYLVVKDGVVSLGKLENEKTKTT